MSFKKKEHMRSDQTDLDQNGGIVDNTNTTTKYRLLKIKPFVCVCVGGAGGLTDVNLIIHSSWLRLMHRSFSENQALP